MSEGKSCHHRHPLPPWNNHAKQLHHMAIRQSQWPPKAWISHLIVHKKTHGTCVISGFVAWECPFVHCRFSFLEGTPCSSHRAIPKITKASSRADFKFLCTWNPWLISNDIANTWGIHLKQRKSRKDSWNPWRNVWSNSRICKHHQAIHNQSVCNCIWEPRNHQNLRVTVFHKYIISTYISTESCTMGMM